MIRVSQAESLFLLVQTAKATDFELPAGDEIAKVLYPGKSIGRAQIRAANSVVHRLSKQNCILKKGSVRRINQARLVTEKVSAEFVLLFKKLCLEAPPEFTISEATFEHEANTKMPGIDFDGLFQHALAGGYITRFGGNHNLLRIGGSLNNQRNYLKLFVEDKNK